MTCKYCGAEVPETEDFCPECGGIVDRDEPEKKKERASREKGSPRINIGLLAALLIVSVLLLAGLCVGALGLFGVIDLPKISFVSGSSNGSGKAPQIEPDPENADHFIVTVFAEAGTALIYENTDGARKEVSVPSTGSVKFRVPLSALIPCEPLESETIEVVPIVYTKNEDGSETRIEGFTPVTVSVPAISVSFDNGDPIVSADGTAAISGSVDPCWVSVTIDGAEVYVGQDGVFSHTLSYYGAGEYTAVFEARYPGYRIFRHSFTVTVEEASAVGMIQFPWEYGDDEFSTRVKNNAETPLEVYGRVPAGATVTAACASQYAELSEPTVAGDGTFSFTVAMHAAGDYELLIHCVTPSGESDERVLHVQRAPEWRSYVESSWASSYEALRYASKQAYKIGGTVTEVIEDGECLVVLLDMGGGNTIILRYYDHYPNAGSLAVGSVHTGIYGHSLGRDENGVPVIYVWFVID